SARAQRVVRSDAFLRIASRYASSKFLTGGSVSAHLNSLYFAGFGSRPWLSSRKSPNNSKARKRSAERTPSSVSLSLERNAGSMQIFARLVYKNTSFEPAQSRLNGTSLNFQIGRAHV